MKDETNCSNLKGESSYGENEEKEESAGSAIAKIRKILVRQLKRREIPELM